jgi:hypothetical protein
MNSFRRLICDKLTLWLRWRIVTSRLVRSITKRQSYLDIAFMDISWKRTEINAIQPWLVSNS